MCDAIFLTERIDYDISDAFIRKMLEFSAKGGDDPIWVFIDSPGGAVDPTFLIVDAMRGCPRPVKTCCIGRAYSSAGLLLLAGPDGRYSFPHGRMMLHQPKLISAQNCSLTALTALSLSLQNQIVTFDAIVSECTGHDEYSIEQELSYDHYFDVQEALDFRLIDSTIRLADIVAQSPEIGEQFGHMDL
jgi:ATP-dependent Clp protease protease subunit